MRRLRFYGAVVGLVGVTVMLMAGRFGWPTLGAISAFSSIAGVWTMLLAHLAIRLRGEEYASGQ